MTEKRLFVGRKIVEDRFTIINDYENEIGVKENRSGDVVVLKHSDLNAQQFVAQLVVFLNDQNQAIVDLYNGSKFWSDKATEKIKELEKENEWLKQKIKVLDSENEKLWETCYHSLQFARQEDITIKRDDKGRYKVYSKNVIPHDSPIISITAPSVLFNEYILNHIIEAIDKISPIQEKEEITDD